MESTQEICAICREACCDFETRCGHLFHEECLKVSMFSRSRSWCPYCQTEISTNKLLERLIRLNGDFSSIPSTCGNIYQLKELIKYGLKIKSSWPLVQIVQNMLELGWDINEKDFWLSKDQRNKQQSLFYASYISGKVDLTHKLIELGCEIDQGMHDQKEENESVIPHAVRINDYEFIKKLIGLGVEINGFDLDKSALNVACAMDNVEMIEFLLENGAEFYDQGRYNRIDLNRTNDIVKSIKIEVYENPLISACLSGSLNAVLSLHNRKPENFKESSIYWDAFAAAIKRENFPLIGLLIELGGNISIESNSKMNLLMVACVFGNVDVIKYVFDKGDFDLNSTDNFGKSAFYFFVKANNSIPNIAEMVKFLIEKGADPLSIISKNENYTALHIACEDHNYKLIEYLLSLTETPSIHYNLKNISPARRGLIELILIEGRDASGNDEKAFNIIDLFLQKGLDINEKNLKGETALHFSYNILYERLKFLLSRGADVNSVDLLGVNCLQKLVCDPWIDESRILLLMDHGIDINSQNNDGWTLMHYLCRTKYLRRHFIGYFLDAGARMDICASDGQTPFDFAFQWGPFGNNIKEVEKRGLNYSKRIPEDVRSRPCDHCKGNSASLKARCGHYLHLTCFNNRRFCPSCDARITISNNVEKMIKEGDFNDYSVLDDQELLILLDNWIENDDIVNFASITNELKSRKQSRGDDFSKDLYVRACAYGRLEFIKFCDSIKLEGDSMPDYVKISLTFFVAVSGSTDIIKYCFGNIGSSYINEKCWALYPIQAAIISRSLETFDYYVKNGANLKVECNSGMNLLQFACSVGAFEIVKKLIEDYKFDPNSTDKKKQNSLFFTVKDPSIKIDKNNIIMSDLIKVPDKSEDECIEMAKYLFDCGTKLNFADNDCVDTPFSIALLYDREKVFNFFVDYSQNVLKKPFKIEDHKTLLISVTRRGKNLKLFEKVIGMGADVNWTDNCGYTALMGACSSGNFEMCRRLIELGANVNAANDNEYTALHYLCNNGNDNAETLELLLENGADIHMNASYQNSALHIAVQSVSLKTVKKLLSAGINPNCFNYTLGTPLHILFKCMGKDENNVLSIAKELVEAGADIHLKGWDFKTPYELFSASMRFRKVAEYFNSLNLDRVP